MLDVSAAGTATASDGLFSSAFEVANRNSRIGSITASVFVLIALIAIDEERSLWLEFARHEKRDYCLRMAEGRLLSRL
jgi:hypothetical protein